MDDDMEDEIIYELFTAHLHIAWRYIGLTTAGLYDLVMPGPGRLLILAFLFIMASVILQSSSPALRHFFLNLNRSLGISPATPLKSLSSLELVSGVLGGSDSVSWELREGIVGVYGMQGRRMTMEDRYSVLQDVDVGEKNMSFFGVFDGHGGQYTAEFVKENLFPSTIEKIKQLRSQPSPPRNGNNNTPTKNGNGKVTNGNGKAEGNGKVTNGNGKAEGNGKVTNGNGKAEGNGKVTNGNGKTEGNGKVTNGNGKTEGNGKVTNGNGKTEGGTKATETKTTNSENATNGKTNGDKITDTLNGRKGAEKTLDEPSPQSCPAKKDTDEHPAQGTVVENLEESQKKDDPYTNLKKRNSITPNPAATSQNKEEVETNPDAVYIDSYKNLNYTRLLTDQIMAVDKHVVHNCKTRTDMSGTTAVVALLDGELLIIGNVGDSRAVMGDLKGSAIPLSFDHKPNQLKERRRIKEAGGFVSYTGVWRVAGILATSRALGDFPLKEPRKLITAEPDVLTFSLRDHKAHFVILATDGLWDVLSNEEAVAYVRDHIHEPDNGAKSLCHHAYQLGSQDNITVVILDIDKLGLQ